MAHYHWFVLALTGPFLYAFTNHIDKQLLDKYFKSGGVGTLLIISSLFSLIALPITYWGDPSVFEVESWTVSVFGVEVWSIAVMALVGLLNVGIVWFYLRALKVTDTSATVVFYQLVPVFGLVFGFFLLGETISSQQGIGMAIIILGTTIVAFELDGDLRPLLRRKLVINMLLACLCWSSQSVIFKLVALEMNVWRTLFWQHTMMFLVGLAILMNCEYRTHFVSAMKENSLPILLLNGFNEAIYLGGSMIVSFAYLMAPVTLVLLGNSFQPIFVLIIAIVLCVFFPAISADKLELKKIIQNVLAIGITIIGSYILLT